MSSHSRKQQQPTELTITEDALASIFAGLSTTSAIPVSVWQAAPAYLPPPDTPKERATHAAAVKYARPLPFGLKKAKISSGSTNPDPLLVFGSKPVAFYNGLLLPTVTYKGSVPATYIITGQVGFTPTVATAGDNIGYVLNVALIDITDDPNLTIATNSGSLVPTQTGKSITVAIYTIALNDTIVMHPGQTFGLAYADYIEQGKDSLMTAAANSAENGDVTQITFQRVAPILLQ